MIDSIDIGKKSLSNVQYLNMIKTQKLGSEQNFLDLIKGSYQKKKSEIIFNNDCPLKSGARQACS